MEIDLTSGRYYSGRVSPVSRTCRPGRRESRGRNWQDEEIPRMIYVDEKTGPEGEEIDLRGGNFDEYM